MKFHLCERNSSLVACNKRQTNWAIIEEQIIVHVFKSESNATGKLDEGKQRNRE